MSRSAAAASARRTAALIYGTAGKSDQTTTLVRQAIKAGFRAIDTAAQPRSYAEDLAGTGIREALRAQGLKRSDVWIQTKFTPAHDQDESSAPYKTSDSISKQVKASIERSLQHLSTDDDTHIDVLLLHSPYKDAAATLEAWQALCQHSERITNIGVSNMNMEQLDDLLKSTSIVPAIVQNAFTAENGYDLRLRAYCRDKGIAYQAYGVLTGNDHILESSTVRDLASAVDCSREGTLYALTVLGLNVSVLNGTSNISRMRDDLAAIEKVRVWREANRNKWMSILSSFKGSLSRGRVL